MSVELKQLLEGLEGADASKVIAHINAKATELKAKLLIDDGKDDIYVPKSRLDTEITKKKKAEDDLKTLETKYKDVPEFEKTIGDLKKEKEDLNKKLNDKALEAEIKIASLAAKPKDATGADVLAFLDRTNIKIGEDGTVTGIADALTALQKSKPYLFEASNGGTGDPGNPDPSRVTGGSSNLGESLAKERFGNNQNIQEARASFFK